MNASLRKLAGSAILVIGLLIYAFVVAIISTNWLPDSDLARLAFYAVAGVVWALPLRPLFRWMQGT